MEYFLNQLINGLCQGAIYALLAIGYSVIVGVVGMVTFTYGEVIMIGAYTSMYMFQYFGNNLLMGIVASFLTTWIMGIAIYHICYERFSNAPRHIPLLCTIGFSILVKNLAQIFFGPNQQPILNVINNTIYTIGPVQVQKIQLIILFVVIVLAVILSLVFNKTTWGISLRAVSQNKTAASMVGINVKRMSMIGNCIGCGLGGIGGTLLGLYYQMAIPTMGGSYGMKAFSASVLGGLTDIPFSAVGGMCLGIIENLGITFSSASFRDIFAFGFLLLVLLIRPEGFKSKKGERV